MFMANGLWDWLRSLFTRLNWHDLPDDKELAEDITKQIVGDLDNTDPIELVEGDPSEVPAVPPDDEEWDPSVHDDEYDDDPLVVITPDEDLPLDEEDFPPDEVPIDDTKEA